VQFPEPFIMSIEIHHAETGDDIARLFPVIRELRPKLKDAAELVARVQRQRDQGYRLIYVTDDAGEPVACAGFRLIEFLYAGRSLYVDDLICLEAWRGGGYAKALMRWMEQFARDEGCETFHLDSGTQRQRAHHFYFREGMSITSFHFVKQLEG
jgi:GNAT superfamily N-acetyltransferase